MKNSFFVLELILSLIISSIIIIYSTIFIKEISFENKYKQELEIDKINFLATKVFIEKNKHHISKLSYKKENLYFDNILLLKNVKEFTLIVNMENISIYINYKNKLIQNWKFSL